MSEEAIRLSGVNKAFSGHVAVEDLSLAVPRGAAFGLLGPNGAGKTTTLRMIMNVLGPDTGTIEILGQPATQERRDRIGYMPEERGLYPRMVVEEQLLFFAELKGVPRKEGTRRLQPWLERLGLMEWRKRKLNELSKGMQQKAQFIATVLHDPDILILDEPLSGLDPVGVNVMRDVFLDLRRRGKTVVLSYEGDGAFLAGLPGVLKVSDCGRYVEIKMAEGADPQGILREAASRLRVSRFEVVEPSLHDIFVEQVTAGGAAAA